MPSKKQKIIEESITLIQCFSCHKSYIEELMKPVKIKEIYMESYQLCTRYLCENCMQRLKELKFVQISDAERKLKTKENDKE